MIALLRVEWQTQWRYGIPLVLFGLSATWAVIIGALSTPSAAAFIIFLETMTAGTMIAGALSALERTTGATAALQVSPLRPAGYVTARVVPLTVLSALSAVPLLLVAGAPPSRLPPALAAVALGAVLMLAVALAVAARRSSFIGFLTTLPWPLVPLLAVPLAVAAGLLPGAAWYAVPTVGVLELLRGTATYPAWALLGYLACWAGAACWLATRAVAVPDGRSLARPAQRPARTLTGRYLFLRADLRNVWRDAMLLPIVLSPLLLGLALRFGFPPLERWLADVHSFELAPYRPVIALLAVVLHVPIIFGMVGGLIVLDDADTGTLGVIRVSPLGVPRYLLYRLALVTLAAALGLAVAAPLSGLVPWSAWAAVLLAVPLAPIFTLAMLAVARGRVQGVAAAKLLGLPAYAPLAAWWLAGAAGWLFAPLPAFWVVRAWDAPGSLALGVLLTAAWLGVLGRTVIVRWR